MVFNAHALSLNFLKKKYVNTFLKKLTVTSGSASENYVLILLKMCRTTFSNALGKLIKMKQNFHKSMVTCMKTHGNPW